ncbi:ATP-binding cassette domain-containing protein [Rhizobium sp. Root1204]|uniref:ATP-binding cassette domain-containing protein n=1 Tax=Rhizobium sp. Root1204 TaxID=1736428 RepID=UPI00071539B6|nr:ATP-binding cassette domain-containing protein [Rhizobium sp. Root1204]KQV36991.1 hypothetical protein ASC96_26570 [Rhizobium sp. Root1204]
MTKKGLEIVQSATQQPVVSLRDIRKVFGKTVALGGVNLDIFPGEIHAIVGENGAGKSTLINVAAGVLPASAGTIIVDGEAISDRHPRKMRALGLTVAYQHPALPSHLTVLECLSLVEPSFGKGGGAERARALIASIASKQLSVDPTDFIGDLSLGQKHVTEIVRALASAPRVLILDEPTEPFKEEDVRSLFDVLRSLKARGIAIVYISHRLHEVEEIADRVSVLRDGELITTRLKTEFTHDDIVQLIVGKPLGQVFPPKLGHSPISEPVLSVTGFGGEGFAEVDMEVKRGEILGLAGVEGQGQREFLRAIAGLNPARSGSLFIHGNPVTCKNRSLSRNAGIGFVPDDRHMEGLFLSLSVQDNLSFGNMDRLANGGLMSSDAELSFALKTIDAFSIKTPSPRTPVSALSGGNQQKVLIAREISADPAVLLIDEPTKGVDVGSKSEVYHQLRRLADQGVAVIVASSDGVELEGLCDKVLVFSRGQVTKVLEGSEVNDQDITAANLKSSIARMSTGELHREITRLGKIVRHDYFPVIVLVAMSAIIAFMATSANAKFLSAYNIGIFLTFLGVLAFISFGQLIVMLAGEIDFSVGPLAGFVVVLSSFWLADGNSGVELVGGVAAVLVLTTIIGLIQGLLIIRLNLPSIVVTLASFFGLQGLSLLLRPLPAGSISYSLSQVFGFQVVMVPFVALLTITAVCCLEWGNFRTQVGRAVRSTGSDFRSAYKLGIKREHAVPLVFALAGLLTGMGGIILAGEVGFGSPTTGINYSLMSVTAVVLGGAIISGGRGSFVATLFGAALVQLTSSAASFLQLGTEWQYWFVGATTLLAAGMYAVARRQFTT